MDGARDLNFFKSGAATVTSAPEFNLLNSSVWASDENIKETCNTHVY